MTARAGSLWGMTPKNKDETSLVLRVEVSEAATQAAVAKVIARYKRGEAFDSFDILETILAAYGEALFLTEGP